MDYTAGDLSPLRSQILQKTLGPKKITAVADLHGSVPRLSLSSLTISLHLYLSSSLPLLISISLISS